MRVLWLGCVVTSVLAGAACDDIEPCAKPGAVQACECSSGALSERRCLPERVWDECACDPLAAPDASAKADAGGPQPQGNVTSDSGATGPGSDAAGGDETGGSNTRDAGEPPLDGATMDLGDGGMSDGGMSPPMGDAGDAGDGEQTPVAEPYRACSDGTDCREAGSVCTAASTLSPLASGSVCEPPCTTTADCPSPAGSYEATPVCTASGTCRLDCSPSALLSPMRSCPSGMQCVAGFGATACVRP